MTAWTSDELNKIGGAEELQIAALKSDGTLRKPTTIWVVRVGDDIYIRSAHGREAGWYRGTQVSHQGRIWAGGIERDVAFVDVASDDNSLHNRLDEAYRSKYRRHPVAYVNPVADSESRTATIKLIPR